LEWDNPLQDCICIVPSKDQRFVISFSVKWISSNFKCLVLNKYDGQLKLSLKQSVKFVPDQFLTMLGENCPFDQRRRAARKVTFEE